jgi:hypothetical protein
MKPRDLLHDTGMTGQQRQVLTAVTHRQALASERQAQQSTKGITNMQDVIIQLKSATNTATYCRQVRPGQATALALELAAQRQRETGIEWRVLRIS